MSEQGGDVGALREAAALMRELVAQAEKQPQTRALIRGLWLGSRFHTTMPSAAMSALADWLDHAAQNGERRIEDGWHYDESPVDLRAAKVAAAYLATAPAPTSPGASA